MPRRLSKILPRLPQPIFEAGCASCSTGMPASFAIWRNCSNRSSDIGIVIAVIVLFNLEIWIAKTLTNERVKRILVQSNLEGNFRSYRPLISPPAVS